MKQYNSVFKKQKLKEGKQIIPVKIDLPRIMVSLSMTEVRNVNKLSKENIYDFVKSRNPQFLREFVSYFEGFIEDHNAEIFNIIEGQEYFNEEDNLISVNLEINNKAFFETRA